MKRQIQCGGRSRHTLQYAPLRCSATTTQAAVLRSHRRQLPALFHFPGRLCRWPKKKTRRRWRTASFLGSPGVPRAWRPFVFFPILVRPCVRQRLLREASRRVNLARFDAAPLSNRCGARARRPIWRPDGRQSSRTRNARGEAGGLPVRVHHTASIHKLLHDEVMTSS